MLAALLFFLLPWSPLAAAAPESAARVEVLEGRALLAGTGVVDRLQAGAGERRIEGPAHLELPAGSRVRVTWSGRASVLLEGRCVLAWSPPAANGAPHWELAEVGSAHLELRRGPLDLSLAGGWKGRLFSGACVVRGTAAGFELEHQAGLPLDLWPPPQDGRPAAPFTVLAGARVRLVRGSLNPLSSEGSRGSVAVSHQRLGLERLGTPAGHPPWRGFAWPWASPPPSAAVEAALARPSVLDLPDVAAQAGDPAPSLAPESPKAPAPLPARESEPAAPRSPSGAGVRLDGVLVLTPYGPRWIEASRAVAPGLRRP
jgi:hypothetical protein